LHEAVREAFHRCGHEFLARARCSISAPAAAGNWVLLERAAFSETDRALVQIFGSRLSVAFDNVMLYGSQRANTHSGPGAVRTQSAANTRLSAQWTGWRQRFQSEYWAPSPTT
jgi:hypothetical protein